MAAKPDSVQLEVRGGVAVVTVDNPPVNALGRHVRQGICDAVREAVADPEAAGIVLACAGRTFIAGADITEFGKPLEGPGFLEMIDVLDDSPKPVVAAITGRPSGAGSRPRSPAITGWRSPPPASGSPRSSSGSAPARGGRSGCRGWWAWRRPWR